ncbi:YihY/virulence factor BrkB family protein [Streptosporangium sp. NPDC000563]|uniref:YihY/virulence factor BrkB family protein n=1 Tax=unclassified Streptosporangium TaxID=2632669 RepID=UPI00331DB46B
MKATSGASRWTSGFVGAWTAVRNRCGWFDHLVRAAVHYDRTDAGRLSAGMTYYAFYATFALALLSFVIMGHVLDTPAALGQVEDYLSDTFPRLDVQALRDARDTAGLIAFFGLPLTGVFWIDSMRSSIRAVWGLEQYPGGFFLRWLLDLAVMVALGLLLSISLTLSFGTQSALIWLAEHTIGVEALPARWALSTTTFVLGICVNFLLSTALMTLPPRLRLSPRRVVGPALVITIGLELLKTIGQVYFNISSANPAYKVVAGAVGMLLFLKLVNVLILFAASHAATSRHGTVLDLATRQPVGEPRTEVVTAPAIPEIRTGPSAQTGPEEKPRTDDEETTPEAQTDPRTKRETEAQAWVRPRPVPRRYDFRTRRARSSARGSRDFPEDRRAQTAAPHPPTPPVRQWEGSGPEPPVASGERGRHRP